MKRVDDADLRVATVNRSLAPPDNETLGDGSTFAEHGGFTTERASRALAIVLLAGAACTVVVIGVILALVRPVLPTSHSVAPLPAAISSGAPSPPQTTVPVDISAQLNLGSQYVNAMSVSPNAVWLATQGVTYGQAGTLIRVDPRTARETASWTIGGDPMAVSSAGNFVWVANGYGDGDGSRILPERDTVEQFNATTGALVYIYRVLDPRGIVANTNSALVISATTQEQTAISLLASGHTKELATLPGTLQAPSISSQDGVAVCGDRAYVALSNALAGGSNATIYSVAPTGGPVLRFATVLNGWAPAVTCGGASLFLTRLIGGGEGSIARVSFADGNVTNVWRGLYPFGLTLASGRLWITYLSQGAVYRWFLASVDPITGTESSTRSMLPAPPNRGDPYLLISGTSGLWTVAGVGNMLLRIGVG